MSCPSRDGLIKKMQIFIVEYHSGLKKEKVLPFVTKSWKTLYEVK